MGEGTSFPLSPSGPPQPAPSSGDVGARLSWTQRPTGLHRRLCSCRECGTQGPTFRAMSSRLPGPRGLGRLELAATHPGIPRPSAVLPVLFKRPCVRPVVSPFETSSPPISVRSKPMVLLGASLNRYQSELLIGLQAGTGLFEDLVPLSWCPPPLTAFSSPVCDHCQASSTPISSVNFNLCSFGNSAEGPLLLESHRAVLESARALPLGCD